MRGDRIDALSLPLEHRLQTSVVMRSRRILLLHEHPGVQLILRRICERYRATLQVVESQSKVFEILLAEPSYTDLVIAKDVGADWFTIAAALLACRGSGIRTPFVIAGDPGDRWTKYAAECGGSAVLIDDRVSAWLLPVLVDDWLASTSQDHPDVADEARRFGL